MSDWCTDVLEMRSADPRRPLVLLGWDSRVGRDGKGKLSPAL
jgi:hypothetical protein